MLLLNTSTTALPQFVSLSLVLNAEGDYDERSVQMTAPVLVSAVQACCTATQAVSALQELHFHLNSTIAAATESSASQGGNQENQVAMGFFKEDARQMEDVQLYSPSSASGMGLYYRLIRTDNKQVVAKLAQLILQMANHHGSGGANNKKQSELNSTEGIWGFLLAVGMAGLPLVTMPSDLHYRLSERVNDVKEIITTKRAGDLDVNSTRSLLATLLLYEDDARMTNSRINGVRLATIPEPDEGGTQKRTGFASPLAAARAKNNRKQGGLDDDDDGGDNRPEELAVFQLESNLAAEQARLLSERLKVLSVAENQTLLQKYALSAFERKANLDLTGGSKGRFSSRKRSSGRDADFDNFEYKGPTRGSSLSAPGGGSSSHHQKLQSSFSSSSHHAKIGSGNSVASGSTGGGGGGGGASSVQLRQPAKDTKLKAGMLSAPRNDGGTDRRRRATGTSFGAASMDDSTIATNNSGTGGGGGGSSTGADFDPFGPTPQDMVSASSGHSGHRPTTNRLQVNVALNEDLSCSYRSSQISSCSVEGVVQVQVRGSSGGGATPFYLFLRDPSEQVESFQENKKYADNVSNAMLEEEDADCKYTVSVPNGDSYFPVVRYKCVEDLRPVPIRVQTRAKTENEQCRVALQISSNPNNEAKLTDLTIIMGVPEDIIGESLVTQPAGGVWNDAKRCVTWCVEELAEGEKFQLQARFQMTAKAQYEQTGERPMFPVLVRCQCLFAQLSDLELEIRDIPEIYPADVTMKIARRFRLSHRERA